MTSIEEADSWIGRTAVDNSGEQIGVISKIWVDDASGQPEWASVRAALGGREALVPLAGTGPVGGGRQFAYSRGQVVDAPHAAQDGHLELDDKETLSTYYRSLGADPVLDDEAGAGAGWMDRLDAQSQPAVPSPVIPWLADNRPAPADRPTKRRFRRR